MNLQSSGLNFHTTLLTEQIKMEISLPEISENCHHNGCNRKFSKPLHNKSQSHQQAQTSDHIFIQILEVATIVMVVVFACYTYYNYDKVTFHVVKGFALVGHPSAQNYLGQRYIQGKGIERNLTKAMEWFEKASHQGHRTAAYNLAIGHLQGYRTALVRGEARQLLEAAAKQGVKMAADVLDTICKKGKHCDY